MKVVARGLAVIFLMMVTSIAWTAKPRLLFVTAQDLASVLSRNLSS
jgi:hypothetical protein